MLSGHDVRARTSCRSKSGTAIVQPALRGAPGRSTFLFPGRARSLHIASILYVYMLKCLLSATKPARPGARSTIAPGMGTGDALAVPFVKVTYDHPVI